MKERKKEWIYTRRKEIVKNWIQLTNNLKTIIYLKNYYVFLKLSYIF